MRILFALLRLAVGLGVGAALVVQAIASVAFANRNGGDYTASVVTNFFSYFTVDSNTFTVLLLLIGAALLVGQTGRTAPTIPEPRWFALARVSVVTHMVITGVVYNVLLRDNLPQGATVPWSNEVLHVVAPAYLLLDWLVAPGRRRMAPRDMWAVIAFPIVWLAYTLIRGPFAGDPYLHTAHWYPYPFLNPVTAEHGYVTVAFYVVLIATVVCLVAAGLLWLSRHPGGSVGRRLEHNP